MADTQAKVADAEKKVRRGASGRTRQKGSTEPKPSPKKSAKPRKAKAAPVAADQSVTSGQPSVDIEKVALGAVLGELAKLPIDVVLSHLDDGFKARVDALRGKSTPEMQAQMRATDGRCAPVFFTVDPDDAGAFHMFGGFENIAAAQDIGADHVFVVTIAHEDAGALQTYLTAKRRDEASQVSEEDDLYMRVHAHHDD